MSDHVIVCHRDGRLESQAIEHALRLHRQDPKWRGHFEIVRGPLEQIRAIAGMMIASILTVQAKGAIGTEPAIRGIGEETSRDDRFIAIHDFGRKIRAEIRATDEELEKTVKWSVGNG